MTKNKTILQAIALLFLLLVLNASFFAVYNLNNDFPVAQKQLKITDNTQNSEQSNTQNNEQNGETTYSESVPFDAVVSVGLQCEFHKIVFVAVPQLVISYFTILKEPVKQTFQSVFLLSYFQNLFKTSILINAP
jgi:hypothetical protein